MPFSYPMARDGLDSPTVEYERGRLAREIPVSTHEAVSAAYFSMAAKRCAWAILPLLFAMIFTAVTVENVRKDLGSAMYVSGVIAAGLFLLGFWLISSACRVYSDRVNEIAVCHTGLRWRKGETRSTALWTDLATVDVDVAVPQTGQTGLVGAMQALSARTTINSVALTLRSGEYLIIRRDTVSDFVRFANTVKSRHEQTLEEAKRGGGNGVYHGAFALP